MTILKTTGVIDEKDGIIFMKERVKHAPKKEQYFTTPLVKKLGMCKIIRL